MLHAFTSVRLLLILGMENQTSKCSEGILGLLLDALDLSFELVGRPIQTSLGAFSGAPTRK